MQLLDTELLEYFLLNRSLIEKEINRNRRILKKFMEDPKIFKKNIIKLAKKRKELTK